MKFTRQTATVFLFFGFTLTVLFDKYADYYLRELPFEGWRLLTAIVMVLCFIASWKISGIGPLTYRRNPSTPRQWAFHIALLLVAFLGIIFFAHQAYVRYYGGLYKTLDSNDLETT